MRADVRGRADEVGLDQAYVGLLGEAGATWKNGAVTALTMVDDKVDISLIVGVFPVDD